LSIDMLREIRIALFIAAALLASPGAALAGSSSGTCSGHSVSAIDQYCEQVPSPGGGHGTGPRTPELATVLPRPVVSKLETNRQQGRLLLLPAPVGRHRASHSHSQARISTGNSLPVVQGDGSPWSTIILVLGAIAALMLVIEAVRRRTQSQQAA